jgi:hypothetical protein
MAISYLTSMMSSVSPLAVIQSRMELAERIGAQAGPKNAYCDEHGTWMRQANGHWQLIAPALTSLAMG